MKDNDQGSHQADALGGRSKQSQRRPIPEANDMPTDQDVVAHVRELERRNATSSASVTGIPELTPHSNKRDLPPTASGPSTRVSRSSDGVISQPNSNAIPQRGKNSADPCDSLGNPSRHRQNQDEFDAKERPVEKLHETKRRQFSKGNTN
jgi:hypothetical protein